jgi:hypothetical protein
LGKAIAAQLPFLGSVFVSLFLLPSVPSAVLAVAVGGVAMFYLHIKWVPLVKR